MGGGVDPTNLPPLEGAGVSGGQKARELLREDQPPIARQPQRVGRVVEEQVEHLVGPEQLADVSGRDRRGGLLGFPV